MTQKWRDTYEGRKSKRMSDWRRYGIIFHDYDLLYDIFFSTTHCNFCECELDTCFKTRKCLDHDHTITEQENVRGVLCHYCNTKDVFTTIEIYEKRKLSLPKP